MEDEANPASVAGVPTDGSLIALALPLAGEISSPLVFGTDILPFVLGFGVLNTDPLLVCENVDVVDIVR